MIAFLIGGLIGSVAAALFGWRREYLHGVRLVHDFELRLAESVAEVEYARGRERWLQDQLRDIGGFVTRRPPRRRWLALSRRIARIAGGTAAATKEER